MPDYPPAESLILTAVMPSPRDLEIARLLGWYRIPLRSAPKVVDVDFLAFYQTDAFGADHRWRIEFIAPVRGHELTTRGELFRDQPEHPRRHEEYYKIQIGSLQALPVPILAERWKRITFLYTTGGMLCSARTINDLVVRSEERQMLWQSLRERVLQAEAYRAAGLPENEKDLDPELLLMLGALGGLSDFSWDHDEKAYAFLHRSEIGRLGQMIALIPPLFMILSGLAVILLSILRKGLGLPWLFSSLAALAGWAVLLAFHWLAPAPMYFIGWNPLEPFVNVIGFQLDLISWPYSFALATLTLAVLFTSAARIESTVAAIWGLDLIFGGLGILAVMASSPLTFVLMWALIDAGEFLVLYRTMGKRGQMRSLVLSYAVQIGSLFLVLLAMMVSRWKGMEISFSQLSYQAGILLFFGAVLRLGVFPRSLPYSEEFRFKRDFGTLLRGIQPATGLILLARLPDLNIPFGGLTLLKLFIAVAALYGSLRWAAAEDQSAMHPYWAIGTAGLAMLAVLNGFQITSVIWGLILILIGGVLGLYSSRDTRIQYIPLMAVLGILGLPYTPAAGGWLGLANAPFSIFTLFGFLIHLVLVIGLVRHLFKPGENYTNLDRWIRVIYPAGLLVLILAQWIIATWGWPGSYTAGVWWAGVVPTVLLAGVYFLYTNASLRERFTERFLRWRYLLRRYFFTPLDAVLRGKWLVDALGYVFALAGQAVNLVSRLLEGEGGFLWVLFLLAMIVTVVMTSGAG